MHWTEKRCPIPPNISNSFIKFDNTDQGSIVNYTCYEGYELKSNNILSCSDDLTWKGALPYCQSMIDYHLLRLLEI